jgi:hypothetical protein
LFSVVGLHEILACVDFEDFLKHISQDIHIEENVIDDKNSWATHLRNVGSSGSLVDERMINGYLLKSPRFYELTV